MHSLCTLLFTIYTFYLFVLTLTFFPDGVTSLMLVWVLAGLFLRTYLYLWTSLYICQFACYPSRDAVTEFKLYFVQGSSNLNQLTFTHSVICRCPFSLFIFLFFYFSLVIYYFDCILIISFLRTGFLRTFYILLLLFYFYFFIIVISFSSYSLTVLLFEYPVSSYLYTSLCYINTIHFFSVNLPTLLS